MIVRKNMAELEKMRCPGLLVWKILEQLRKMVGEGVSTLRSGSDRREDDARMRAPGRPLRVFDRGRGNQVSLLCCVLGE
jgi:hypothetical protein